MEEKVFSPQYLPSEIPPIFAGEQFAKSEKSGSGVFLYRLILTAALIIALIVLKVFFPDIYAVIDSWLTEKLGSPPLAL